MNDNEDDKSGLNEFISKYGGATLGGIIALILYFTKLYNLLVCIIIVVFGIFIGNYIQKNKTSVKEKLKSFIDKF